MYQLPPIEKNKKTLVLDLDETLIHSNFEVPTGKGNIIEFTYNKVIYSFEVFVRPGVPEFLSKMSEHFELLVFTASRKEYADRVISYIDPNHKYIKQAFYREDCIGIKDKVFVKDLRILENRKLEQIILLDNSMYAFHNQLSNGVLINSFYTDPEDTELYNVMGYLLNYAYEAQDVRLPNSQVFGFQDLLNDIHNESKSFA